MASKEHAVKQAVKKELDKAGVYYFMPAANGYGRAGIPDFVCCVNGRFLALECKAGRKQPTALQDRELNRIIAAGGTALVINENPEHSKEELHYAFFDMSALMQMFMKNEDIMRQYDSLIVLHPSSKEMIDTLKQFTGGIEQ